ncbi:MAG: hypothetical protein IPK16_28030 [Anaerolineales bacterium]|nr:hypothetical protein [Anaerolineales bacterium]
MRHQRDNSWDNFALNDSAPDRTIPANDEQLATALEILEQNYTYTVGYTTNQADPVLKEQLSRLLFRLLGVYHGATLDAPAVLDFSGAWLPALDTFRPDELVLQYGAPNVTFMDVYYLNAYADLSDVLDKDAAPVTKCSAFVKRLDDDVLIAHNTWSGFLDQSMAQTYAINGDLITFNSTYPGLIASTTDFGYNKAGILFNETTHHYTYTEPKTDALWMLWRAALAEQFAGSIDALFHFASLAPSGTYMNGYMVIAAKTREIGLVEMGYKSFVFFKSADGGPWVVTTEPEGQTTDYDTELVQPDVILGVNYPASVLIEEELQAVETRPARRAQFLEFMDGVTDVESAKVLITYTAPDEPLSIYGRWDLGWGTTPSPKTVPDGAIDAKVTAAAHALQAQEMEGRFDPSAVQTMFWMKYGTPVFDGKPFIWSESQWKGQPLRHVPDVVAGDWQQIIAPLK